MDELIAQLERAQMPVRDDQNPPLCVDLDGTLIQSDLLIEATLLLLKQDLFSVVRLPLWLMRGKAYLKRQIASRVRLDPSRLPYYMPLLDHLQQQKAAGRMLVLATAADESLAQQVADHLQLFDAVVASDGTTNLSGSRKRDRLVDMFGERGFDYAGNEATDLQVWSHARSAIVVSSSPRLAAQAGNITSVGLVLERKPAGLAQYLRALRLHQWLKNLLIFVPLALAHQIHSPALLLQTILAFVAFGLCASSVYVLNDLLDLPADRVHASKRRRPFAAGTIPIQQGLILIPTLLFGSVGLALLLPPLFLAALCVYFGATLAYSLRLKRTVLLDVLTLAGLYTMRLVAGSAATGVVLSFWLLAFSMFLFLSLALVKRYAELLTAQKENKPSMEGRGYAVIDLETLAQLGITSGNLAVLVLALYINSSAVTALYRNPGLIWLLCPILLYWISYMWLLTRRDRMHEDPVVFAIRDRRSHWVLGLLAMIVWAAS